MWLFLGFWIWLIVIRFNNIVFFLLVAIMINIVYWIWPGSLDVRLIWVPLVEELAKGFAVRASKIQTRAERFWIAAACGVIDGCTAMIASGSAVDAAIASGAPPLEAHLLGVVLASARVVAHLFFALFYWGDKQTPFPLFILGPLIVHYLANWTLTGIF